jgi:hypothetical protein
MEDDRTVVPPFRRRAQAERLDDAQASDPLHSFLSEAVPVVAPVPPPAQIYQLCDSFPSEVQVRPQRPNHSPDASAHDWMIIEALLLIAVIIVVLCLALS